MKLSIGQLSIQTGEPVKTLRYWTDKNLLKSQRGQNSYRYFAPEMVQRVTFIRNTQALGFKLSEIKSILDLKRKGIKPCSEVRTELTGHLKAVQQRIHELQKLELELRNRLAWENEHPDPECETEGCVYLTEAA